MSGSLPIGLAIGAALAIFVILLVTLIIGIAIGRSRRSRGVDLMGVPVVKAYSGAPVMADISGVATYHPTVPDAAMSEIVRHIRDENKIRAIKVYREQTGLGLREAKAAIDKIAKDLGVVFRTD